MNNTCTRTCVFDKSARARTLRMRVRMCWLQTLRAGAEEVRWLQSMYYTNTVRLGLYGFLDLDQHSGACGSQSSAVISQFHVPV